MAKYWFKLGALFTEDSTSAKCRQWLNTVIIRAEVQGQLFPTPVIFITCLPLCCIHLKTSGVPFQGVGELHAKSIQCFVFLVMQNGPHRKPRCTTKAQN